MEGCVGLLVVLFLLYIAGAVAWTAISISFQHYPVETVLGLIAFVAVSWFIAAALLKQHKGRTSELLAKKQQNEAEAARLKAEQDRAADLVANAAYYAGFREGQKVRTLQGQLVEVIGVRRDILVVRAEHRILQLHMQHVSRIEQT